MAAILYRPQCVNFSIREVSAFVEYQLYPLIHTDIRFGTSAKYQHDIDGLMQERRNSIPNALELRLSYINPLTWHWWTVFGRL